MEDHKGKWHVGDWKGDSASRWRMTHEAIHMMNDHLINQINETVGEDDTLWHLGDFAFARKHEYYEKCRYYRDRIVCRNMNIIWGNHDYATCDEPGDDDYVIRDLFDKAFHLQKLRRSGQSIFVCHYSMAIWDKSHRGAWMLYGHSHNTAERGLEAHFPGRRSLDVGVDNAKVVLGEYRPFSLEELQRYMRDRQGHVIDHHCPRNVTAPEEVH